MAAYSIILVFTALLLAPAPAWSGEVDIVSAKIERTAQGVFSFSVTLKHADTGWDHYADKWEVLAPDGSLLGTRVLHHPHVDEQPFTRSLSGVKIASKITAVTIRAHDSEHGWADRTLRITVPHGK